mgnify:CR=1 FL=1
MEDLGHAAVQNLQFTQLLVIQDISRPQIAMDYLILSMEVIQTLQQLIYDQFRKIYSFVYFDLRQGCA